MKVILIAFLFLHSCAHMKSGQYIMVREGDSIEDIAKEFHIQPQAIVNANRKVEFRVGEWYFIPQDKGIGHLFKKRLRYGNIPSSKEFITTGKLLWPVPSVLRVSSHFGKRWGRKHEGMDIPGKVGTHILAAEDGIVIYSGNGLRGYGNLTIISHGKGLSTVYAHANKNYTKKGQKVYRGQVIAQLGNTGRSTGPHLHFEVRIKDKAVDPFPYLRKSRKTLLAYREKRN